jgi:hypothetical protein
LGIPTRIKIDINFVDKTLYPHETRLLKSFITGLENKELPFLYKEAWNEYNRPIEIKCYDPREIYTDKVRAIMTRPIYKLRDTIDIYTLENQYGYSIPKFENQIKRKTNFILNLYTRYRKNIAIISVPDRDYFKEKETKLLINQTPKDLHNSIQRIHNQIRQLQTELTKSR